MKLITLATIAATAVALALAPAAAKSNKKHHRLHHHYSQMQRGNDWNGGYYGGWNSRNVSDPSLGHPSAAEVSRWTGRCIEDLGYGRYEACGW